MKGLIQQFFNRLPGIAFSKDSLDGVIRYVPYQAVRAQQKPVPGHDLESAAFCFQAPTTHTLAQYVPQRVTFCFLLAQSAVCNQILHKGVIIDHCSEAHPGKGFPRLTLQVGFLASKLSKTAMDVEFDFLIGMDRCNALMKQGLP